MIKYFDSFYGGHVSSDNLGFSGIPVDLRRETDRHLAQIFDYTLEIAKIIADNTQPYHKGYETAVEKVRQLHEKAFGN